MKTMTGLVLLVLKLRAGARQEDSLDNERKAKMVSLFEVMIRTDLNVARLINKVKKNTIFYKAFQNLYLLGFSAWNDIRVKDKKGNTKASLQSKTKQIRKNACSSMDVLDENSTAAKIYRGLGYNLFFKKEVCLLQRFLILKINNY